MIAKPHHTPETSTRSFRKQEIPNPSTRRWHAMERFFTAVSLSDIDQVELLLRKKKVPGLNDFWNGRDLGRLEVEYRHFRNPTAKRGIKSRPKGYRAMDACSTPAVGEVLLKHGYDLSRRGMLGETSLHVHSTSSSAWFQGSGGHEPMVDFLLGHIDPNTVDNEGCTPLHWAAGRWSRYDMSMNYWICHRLIQAGADPTIRDLNGNRPADYGPDEQSPASRRWYAMFRDREKAIDLERELAASLPIAGSRARCRI